MIADIAVIGRALAKQEDSEDAEEMHRSFVANAPQDDASGGKIEGADGRGGANKAQRHEQRGSPRWQEENFSIPYFQNSRLRRVIRNDFTNLYRECFLRDAPHRRGCRA